MEFFDQTNYHTNLGYVNYPQNLYACEPTSYSNTNQNTYYHTNLRNSNTNPAYASAFTVAEDRASLPTQSQLDEALQMIQRSVMDELHDELFYNALINQAMQEEDKQLIMEIRDDEIKHNKLLRDVYYSLTGITLPQAKEMQLPEPMTYLQNLKHALMGEIAAASKYRKIMSAMPDKKNYASLMEIMVDEIRHASKYNYLIAKAMHMNGMMTKDEPNN